MTAPKRQLGLYVTAAIVIANMIGTGVFTSTGFQAAGIHDPMSIILCWVVGGIAALCGAACYAELGSMIPKAGGEYVYLREAYHPIVGFMSGWVSLTAGFSAAIATAALAFAQYVGVIIPGVADHMKIVAIGLVLAIMVLHAFDTKIGGRVQAVFTGMKVLLIIVFILAGLFVGHGDWGHFASQSGGFSNVLTKEFAISLMYVSLAYSGWNAAAYIAGEVKEPAKTLPRSLLLGTGLVMVLYVALNIIYFYAVPSQVLATTGPIVDGHQLPVIEVGAVSAVALFGSTAGHLIASLIAIALVSAVSAMVMAGPRVYASMAADHALPHQLAKHNARGVPARAVVTQAAFAIAFVVVADLQSLMAFVAFTLAIFAALACGALFIFRRRKLPSAYRTPLYPITPIVYIALSAWIVYARVSQAPKQSAYVLLILAAGAVAYYFAPKPEPIPEAKTLDE